MTDQPFTDAGLDQRKESTFYEAESLIVYGDMKNIPRLDLARLTNVAGAAVSSLDAEPDFRRKLLRLVA